jgi:hypothetical protein
MNEQGNMQGKWPAFTMIELVVAMLISAIVVAIVFYAWSLFSAQLQRRQAQSGKMAEYVLFHRALGRDVEKAQRISDSAGYGSLRMDIDGHRVGYSIGADYILRDLDGVGDTFHLGGKVRQVRYVNDSIPLISILQLLITVDREDLVLTLRKEYTSAELLMAEKERGEQ